MVTYLNNRIQIHHSFNQKYADETGKFWPIMAEDIDGDGVTEVVVVNSDTSINVWKVNNDLTLSNPKTLRNFTEMWFGQNILDAPNGVLADINADGIKELWFVDVDGDIFSYNILGTDNYQEGSVINTGFLGSAAYLAMGIIMEIIKMSWLFYFIQLMQLI